jgi:hypothetical protein
VDVAEGSAVLACACARVLRSRLERLWQEPDRDELLRHALLYGHQYLTRALAQAEKDVCQLALQRWTELLLEQREEAGSQVSGGGGWKVQRAE